MKDESERSALFGTLFIVGLGLLLRLTALPFAALNNGDPAARVWIAWRWLEQPKLITYGVWGPLHTYLLAAVLALWRDPLWPPVLLNTLFFVATAVVLYFFCRQEFGSHGPSLLTAIAYLFYPVAASNSSMATVETPFNFFLVLSLWLLAKARSGDGTRWHALGAGLVLTLAGMLRYEAWFLTPFLACLLWRRKAWMGLFLGAAVLHPVFWLAGNWWQTHDALYSFHATVGGGRRTTQEPFSAIVFLRRLFFFPSMTLLGMTPVAALACLAGAACALWRRRANAVWLFPIAGLLLILVWFTVDGGVVAQVRYTAIVGTLLFPYWAVLGEELRELLPTRLSCALAVCCVVAMGFGNDPRVSLLAPAYSVPESVSSIAGFELKKQTRALSAAVKPALTANDTGFISDFWGWDRTFQVALATRLPPERIFLVPCPTCQDINNTVDLPAFLQRYPQGVLLLEKDGGLAAQMNWKEAQEVDLAGQKLRLEKIYAGVIIHTEDLEAYRYQPAQP